MDEFKRSVLCSEVLLGIQMSVLSRGGDVRGWVQLEGVIISVCMMYTAPRLMRPPEKQA